MTSWNPQANDLFLKALQLPSTNERRKYLDDACGNDPTLRAEVDALLEASARAGQFLEPPAVAPPSLFGGEGPGVRGLGATVDTPTSEGPGTIIGPYKLLEQIGEGGMGTVWMAQQTEPVKRLVAVKLIKPGMDSKQVLARFEAERQALALMDHPNIAKVFDGGMTGVRSAGGSPASPRAGEPPALRDGRPYFVMELVKGVPITKYCDEHHLTPKQRLELFMPVCQAIQHAHQKGIIHRDLKPSNVLIALYDGKPVPKVIDFGVAKAAGQQLTERTLVTGFGNIVGTLEYMSPEQAELNNQDIDTRSDIYSLGVLLYELLTGSTPFTRKELEKAGMLEMLRVIREEEPSKPSTKLSTAEGLPTLAANRGTEPAKLTKLVRGELDWIVMKALEKDRNRRYETANGFAMDVQRYLADEAVLACPPSVGYRLRKFGRRNKTGLMVAALVLFFLVLLGSGVGWTVRDRAAREADAARQQAERQTKITGQVESVFAEVDRLEREQKWPEALAAARQAEAIVASGEADAAIVERVRERLRDLAFIDRLEQIGLVAMTWAEGKPDYAAADQSYARAFRDYGLDVEALAVETLIDRLRGRPTLGIPLAAALDDWVFARRQVYKEDTAAWKPLITVARGVDSHPLRDRLRSTWGQPVSEVQDELRRLADSIDIRAQHPATLVSLAYALRRVGHSDCAARLLRDSQRVYPGDYRLNYQLASALDQEKDPEAIRFCTAAVAIRPNSAGAHNNLGLALAKHNKLDEAIASYKRAIEVDPTIWQPHNNLGYLLLKLRKLDQAVPLYKKAIQIEPKHVSSHGNLGYALMKQGKLDDAIACFKKVIELNPNDAQAYNNLGATLGEQNKLDESIVAYRKAIEIEPKHASAYSGLGAVLGGQKKLDEAIAAHRKAIELEPDNAMFHSNLGVVLTEKGGKDSVDEAIKACREAVRLGPDMAGMHYNLGIALRKQKDLPGALAAFQRAGALFARPAIESEVSGPSGRLSRNQNRSSLATGFNTLGLDFEYARCPEEAKAAYRESLALWKSLVAEFPDNHSYHNDLAGSMVNLARVLRRSDKDLQGCRRLLEDAEVHHKTALKADPKHPAYWDYYRQNRSNLATTAAMQRDHVVAAAAVEEWARSAVDVLKDFRDGAYILARCTALATHDKALTDETRRDLAERYAKRAVDLLREAVGKGFKNVDDLKTTEWDDIGSHPAFRKLLAELQGQKK